MDKHDILNEIFKIGTDKAPAIHRWAVHLYEEIMEKEDAHD